MHILDLPIDCLKTITAYAGNTINISLVHPQFHQAVLETQQHAKKCPINLDDDLSFEFSRWLYSVYGHAVPMHSLYNNSLRQNDLEFFKWCASKCTMKPFMLCDSFRYKHYDLNIIKWCMENGFKLIGKSKNVVLFNSRDSESIQNSDRQPCLTSAAAFSTSAVKWLVATGFPWCRFTTSAAAKHGNLELIKWALRNGCEWCPKTTAKAAKHGHFELIKWCIGTHHSRTTKKQICEWSPDTTSKAAQANRKDIIIWALQNGADWCNNTAYNAARYGHLELLQWCLDEGWPSYVSVSDAMRSLSHEDIVATCPKLMLLTEAAAMGGHLNIIQYCRRRGIPWSTHTTKWAATHTDVEIVKWCHENGCKWDYNTLEYIATDALNTAKWCIENGCPKHHKTISTLMFDHEIDAISWCLDNDFPWRNNTRKRKGPHVLMYALCGLDEAADLIKLFVTKASSTLRGFQWGNFHIKDIIYNLCDCTLSEYTYMYYETCNIERMHMVEEKVYKSHSCNIHPVMKVFDLIKWCVERGCHWGYTSIDAFLNVFSIEQLDWCLKHKCRFTKHTLRLITESQCDVRLLKWALKNKCF